LSARQLRIINVMATSLDGQIAAKAHERDEAREASGFTSPDDRSHLEGLLASADAVILGSSSLKASGGALEIPRPDGSLPIWAVLTQSGLPADCPFFRQCNLPRWLVSPTPQKHVPKDIRSIVYGSSCPVSLLVEELDKAGARRVLLFGGSEINRLFYEANLVDELILTICPIIIANSGSIPLVAPDLRTPKHFCLTSSHTQGDLVFLSYDVRKS
jgi:5-amino-6-(5-phosphoribosylamino)uracil reductase